VCDVLSGIRGVRGQLAEQFVLDMVGRQVAGQWSALPGQDRYDVQFHFVELPARSSACAAPAPWAITSPSPEAARACQAHSGTSVT
jgi:hypothetical protein